MKKHNKLQAFTLVELIITIVILSILSTIAFLSFSSYSSSSRDSVRLSDISNIAKWLVVQYSIWWSYIIPDNSINIYSWSNTIIWYQWKVWSNTINNIKLSNNNNSWKDPLDNTYYTYNINYNKSKYQVTWYLESKWNVINRVGYEDDLYEDDLYDSWNSAFLSSSFWAKWNGVEWIYENNSSSLLSNVFNWLIDISTTLRSAQYDDNVASVIARNEAIYNNFSLINEANATTYTNRYPYTKWDSIWVILSSIWWTGSIVYIPLEDSWTGIDVSSWAQVSWKVLINNNTDSSTGVSVVNMSGYVSSDNTTTTTYSLWGGLSNPWLSCNDIKTQIPSSTDWTYRIKPDSNPSFQVYCDMTMDWWGWTLIALTATWVDARIISATWNITINNPPIFSKLSDTQINATLGTNSWQRYIRWIWMWIQTYWKVTNIFNWDSSWNIQYANNRWQTQISKNWINWTYFLQEASATHCAAWDYYSAWVHYWDRVSWASCSYAFYYPTTYNIAWANEMLTYAYYIYWSAKAHWTWWQAWWRAR